MSRKSVTPKPPTPKTPAVPAELADLLHHVEDRCNRAVQVINVTERAIGGAEMALYQDEDFQRLVGASLEQIAADLTMLSDRALKARVAGGAA